MKLAQFDKVEATFSPLRIDDLVSGADDFIGQRRLFQAAWVIEGGQHDGLWAMSVMPDPDQPFPPFAWVPECDLTDARQPNPAPVFAGGGNPYSR